MLFRLNWGTHRVVVNGKSKTYSKGDIIESKQPLDKLFAMKLNAEWKFEQVEDVKAAKSPNIPTVKRSPSDTVEGSSEQLPFTTSTAVISDEIGDDMTDEFPRAEKLSLKVFFNGSRYTVVDPKDDKPVHTEKFVKPKDVNMFLKQYSAE